MCGDYDSVIGMQKEAAIAKFLTKVPGDRLAVAESTATVCGLLLETGTDGLARRAEMLRIGGRLVQAWPEFSTNSTILSS
jgi:calcineurin-like phosphoesterase